MVTTIHYRAFDNSPPNSRVCNFTQLPFFAWSAQTVVLSTFCEHLSSRYGLAHCCDFDPLLVHFLHSHLAETSLSGIGEHCQFWVMTRLEAFPTPLLETDLQLIEQFKQLGPK